MIFSLILHLNDGVVPLLLLLVRKTVKLPQFTLLPKTRVGLQVELKLDFCCK